MPEQKGSPQNGYTADEMMTIAAARMLRNGAVCFVGIGLPSTAAQNTPSRAGSPASRHRPLNRAIAMVRT